MKKKITVISLLFLTLLLLCSCISLEESCTHNYQTTAILKQATSTETGEIQVECTNCGDTYIQTIPVTGDQDNTPTDTETPVEDKANDTSGEVNQPDNTETEKAENTACSHTDTSIINKTDATCTEDGYSGDTYCELCNTVIKKGARVEAEGHNTEIKNKKDATCTEVGYTGDTYCKTCKQVVSTGSEIKRSEHNTEIRNKKEATTTAEGYTGDTYCTNCKTIIKSGEKIPKIENTTSEVVYITQTGKKYHSTKHCSGLSNANAIYESTLTEAKNKGLGPCSKCH